MTAPRRPSPVPRDPAEPEAPWVRERLARAVAQHGLQRRLGQALHDARQPVQALRLFLQVLEQRAVPANADLLAPMNQAGDGIEAGLRDLSSLISNLGDDLGPVADARFAVQWVLAAAEAALAGPDGAHLPVRTVASRLMVIGDPAVLLRPILAAALAWRGCRGTDVRLVLGCRQAQAPARGALLVLAGPPPAAPRRFDADAFPAIRWDPIRGRLGVPLIPATRSGEATRRAVRGSGSDRRSRPGNRAPRQPG